MSAKSGLGRGLDSLIPTDFDTTLLQDEADRVEQLGVEMIVANPSQPRTVFDETALGELAESIRRYGIVQPLVVSPQGKKYVIVAGERRWRAAKLAGLSKVPALVRTTKELEQLEIALVENVQRVDLGPLEQAVSVERLHQQFNLTYADIASRLGKAQTTVINIVRLLQLPEPARKALQERQISEGHARQVLALKHMEEKQQELLALIIRHGWSVRQAEQYVTSLKAGFKEAKETKARMATETPETKQLAKRYGAPVTIRRTARGGRLEIGFKTDEELTKLLKELNS